MLLIKTDDLHKDIVDDVEKWFDTSNYNEIRIKRPLPVERNKKSNRFGERRERRQNKH